MENKFCKNNGLYRKLQKRKRAWAVRKSCLCPFCRREKQNFEEVMTVEYHLERFVTAQQTHYPRALQEIKSGRKQSCWMWYVFPQIAGLGHSETARYYAIRNMDEARAYMQNAALRNNLIEISKALLDVDSNDAAVVMGWPDNLKLQSSMTLFLLAEPECVVFQKVLDKFFHGEKDQKTICSAK